jgi:hypothetical protein
MGNPLVLALSRPGRRWPALTAILAALLALWLPRDAHADDLRTEFDRYVEAVYQDQLPEAYQAFVLDLPPELQGASEDTVLAAFAKQMTANFALYITSSRPGTLPEAFSAYVEQGATDQLVGLFSSYLDDELLDLFGAAGLVATGVYREINDYLGHTYRDDLAAVLEEYLDGLPRDVVESTGDPDLLAGFVKDVLTVDFDRYVNGTPSGNLPPAMQETIKASGTDGLVSLFSAYVNGNLGDLIARFGNVHMPCMTAWGNDWANVIPSVGAQIACHTCITGFVDAAGQGSCPGSMPSGDPMPYTDVHLGQSFIANNVVLAPDPSDPQYLADLMTLIALNQLEVRWCYGAAYTGSGMPIAGSAFCVIRNMTASGMAYTNSGALTAYDFYGGSQQCLNAGGLPYSDPDLQAVHMVGFYPYQTLAHHGYRGVALSFRNNSPTLYIHSVAPTIIPDLPPSSGWVASPQDSTCVDIVNQVAPPMQRICIP